MSQLQDLSDLLSGTSRVIVISDVEVNLKSRGNNGLFVMRMVEGSSAAGGRGAGFGERRINMAAFFRLRSGSCEELFRTEDRAVLDALEVPYQVSRIPITLADGSEAVGYGVVDPELVSEYSRKVGLDTGPSGP